MASEFKGYSIKHSRTRGGQSGKTEKSDPAIKESPKSFENAPFKKITVEEKKSHNHPQKGAVSSLTSKVDSTLHLGNPKQAPTVERTPDQEKKASDLEIVKDSSSSAKVSPKISEKTDFVESGKSSLCRGSTSTDISDESSCSSLSSSINRPHKANDIRWEAIQAIRTKDGNLDLRHFRLLKKLGCGDIGSVYLSELCGTKCYFAMKVMDKAALASRKKLLRAQTEREILQSLDHPFLPTLYTHFETEKFSCLVMEFCPGGDLHTLRQRQPGKHFSEQAVK